MPLTRVSIKYKETCKNTLYIQTDKNTQEHTRHALKWNQLYSDSKTDFGSVWWFCNLLQFYPRNSKKKVHNI